MFCDKRVYKTCLQTPVYGLTHVCVRRAPVMCKLWWREFSMVCGGGRWRGGAGRTGGAAGGGVGWGGVVQAL